MSNRIRVRSTLQREWIWELRTPDGHGASTSDVFASRDACEVDALKQGLPVTGLRKGRASKPKPVATGLNIRHDGRGIWRWEFIDTDRTVAAASTVAFLTRDECARDAERRAPCLAEESDRP